MIVIGIPNQRRVSASQYVMAWRELKKLPPDTVVPGWEPWDKATAGEILHQIRTGVHDRINRQDLADVPGGRTTSDEDILLCRDAKKVRDWNAARVISPGSGFETALFRNRFPDLQARMRDRED